MRTPGAARLIPLLLALAWAGCGGDSGSSLPPAARLPEAERFQRIQASAPDASPGAAEMSLADLYRNAVEDPNEFLRGLALLALALRRPAGQPPPGFRVELRRVVQEDPDLNRRSAAILLLHFEGPAALEEAALVYQGTGNPETAHQLAVAAADILAEPHLVAHWQDPRGAVQSFVREVVRIRTRKRDGLPVAPLPRPR